MGRSPCCDESDLGLKKGPWTPEEDEKLLDYVRKHGHGNWRGLPKRAGLNRCGKSCRLRWTNYLRPDIKRGNYSDEEEQVIINLHSVLGNKWSKIAAHLPGRTDNEIKNHWNTHLRKKLLKRGIDPKTHKPICDLSLFPVLSQLLSASSYLTTLTNPLNNNANFVKSETDTTTQLAKIQLLQTIMQVISPTPLLPNITENGLLGAQNVNQFEGLVPLEFPNFGVKSVDPPQVQLPMCDFPDFGNSMTCFEEGGFQPEALGFYDESPNVYYRSQTESPAMVSVSEESSSAANSTNPSDYSPNSNIFEALEKFLDDDENQWPQLGTYT